VSRLLFQETTKVEGIHPKVAGTEQDDISATEVDISSPPKDVPDTPHLNQEETATIRKRLEAIRSKPSILNRAKHSFGTSGRSIDTKSSASSSLLSHKNATEAIDPDPTCLQEAVEVQEENGIVPDLLLVNSTEGETKKIPTVKGGSNPESMKEEKRV
jgi:hypothetical protein